MSIAEFCVKRPVFTTMLVTLFVVTGTGHAAVIHAHLLPKQAVPQAPPPP